MLVSTGVYAAPTNEQLYQMLLNMKTEHESLKKEVADSKVRESDLQVQLHKAKAELVSSNVRPHELPKDEEKKVPNVKEGFFASAGALVVKPHTDRKSYNVDGSAFDYTPGFQVATGYQADNNWDYTLRYKHFDTNGSVTFPNLGCNGIGCDENTNPRYKSSYNALDFEIGKLLSLSDNASLRVSGGIRYAMMSENLDLSSYTEKNNFWGIGPRITAAPTWKPFGNNFRVFADVGASLLNGQNLNTYSHSGGFFSQSGSTRSDPFVAVIESGSGIGYAIKTNLVDIDLSAGYQFERWLADSYDSRFRGFDGAYGKITFALAPAGLLSVSTVDHAGNFDGFSLGLEGHVKSTSTSINVSHGYSSFNFENLGGKHDFIPAISGSYTFAVAPQFLLGIGATYDLLSTDVGGYNIDGRGKTFSATIKEKNHYSIFVTPGYLVNDTTLLYAKIAYHQMKGELSAEDGSESLKLSGIALGAGFGAGVKLALTQNVSGYAEAQYVDYADKTIKLDDVNVKLKPSSTIGALGLAYKF